MKIGIDCRLFGPKHTGIGRYTMNLVEELLKLYKENEYILFTNSKNINDLTIEQCNNITIVQTNINHYSLQEQVLLPGIIKRQKVDLMHFPHFNVPVFYRGKYVVTIHDLIKHTSRGTATTTRSSWLYWFKYLGYKFVFNRAVKRAEKIITPSQFVKDEIIKEYDIASDKIVVAYEGVESKLKAKIAKLKNVTQNLELLEKYKIRKPYLLYVGSVYPHKNIGRLIEAVKTLVNNYNQSITLVIVCARNVFSQRLHSKIVQLKAQDFVNFTGFVPDEDLPVLYKEAKAFVFPTLSEGFGLPGLEAMEAGCPVICSNIPVLREVYGKAAVYFDPVDSKNIAEKINLVLEEGKRAEMVKEGKKQSEKYSWSKMAEEVLKVYFSL